MHDDLFFSAEDIFRCLLRVVQSIDSQCQTLQAYEGLPLLSNVALTRRTMIYVFAGDFVGSLAHSKQQYSTLDISSRLSGLIFLNKGNI